MAQIETDRLVLRPAQAEDAVGLWEVFGNPETMKYWSTLPHSTPSQTQELVEGMMALGPDPTYFTITVDGRVIGAGGFWQGDEVGYILHHAVWGQGFGKEALAGLIAHGFEVCGFERITADVDPRNDASIGLLTKMGFAETGRAAGTIQIGEVWVDSVYFALERPAPDELA